MYVQEHEIVAKYRNTRSRTLTRALSMYHCSLTHKHKIPFSRIHPQSTIDSTMKKRDTAKAADDASDSDGEETKEKSENAENGDESADPDEKKATDSQAEEADNADENGTADKSTEDVNDDDKDDKAADEADVKKKTNGKKTSSDKKGSPRKFIRLTCVHCGTKSVTFQVNFEPQLTRRRTNRPISSDRNTQTICTRENTRLRCGRWRCDRNRKSPECAPLNARPSANWKRLLPTSRRNHCNSVCCAV